jgi:hypothetical protein
VRDVAPAWCDFGEFFYVPHNCHLVTDSYTASTFIYSWKYFAVGASLCIGRHLEWVTSSRSGISTRRNTVLFEVMCCCFTPLISIPIRTFIAPIQSLK